MPDNNNKTTYELHATISFLKADYYESDWDFLNHQFIAKVPYLKNIRKIIVRSFEKTASDF